MDSDEATLWLVEWPDRGSGALPPADLTIALSLDGAGRRAQVTADTPTGQAWLKNWAGARVLAGDS